MWRPKDWDSDKKLVFYSGGRQVGRSQYVINKASFEAGADDMLEALMEDGLKVDISKGVRVTEGSKPIQVLGHTVGTPSKGTLVFIPEEDE